LKDKIQKKKDVLNGWLSTSSPLTFDQHVDNNSNLIISTLSYAWGPSLSKYIQLTSDKTYGASFIDTKNRQIAEKKYRFYIERFLLELDQRFSISKVQECLGALFDPAYLHENEQRVCQTGYRREQLAFLSKRYDVLVGFDPYKVATEWDLYDHH
jgi:hypothetical protein